MEGQPIHVGFRSPVPFLLVPASSRDQLPRLRLGHGCGDPLHHLVPIRHIHQLQLELGRTDAAEVDVAVDESRDSELAIQIDDLRVRSYVGIDLNVGADGQNLPVQDRHRLTIGNSGVHRDDHTVVKDQLCRLAGRG